MSERFWRKSTEIFRNSVFLAAAFQSGANAFIVGPRIARALSAGYSGYSTNETIHPPAGEYDLLAVLGAGGSYKDQDGILRPGSIESLRLNAAAEYLVNNPHWANDPKFKVLLTDGDEEIGKANKIYLQDKVKEVSKGKLILTDDKVCLDLESFNTSSNINEIEKFIKEKGLNRVLIITNWFHVFRSEILANSYGLESDFLTVEDSARLYDPSSLPAILKLNRSRKMDKILKKERVALLGLGLDRTGKLTELTYSLRKP